MNDTKLVGDISEMMTVVELLRRGFSVLRPVGDRLPYDIALDIGGRLVRLQVRTAYKSGHRYIGNVRNCKTNRAKYSFVKSDTKNVEFFVFVIQDTQTFYVIPSAIIDLYSSSILFTPNKSHRSRKHCDPETFRNAFELLKG